MKQIKAILQISITPHKVLKYNGFSASSARAPWTLGDAAGGWCSGFAATQGAPVFYQGNSAPLACQNGSLSQIIDPPYDFSKQVPRHDNLVQHRHCELPVLAHSSRSRCRCITTTAGGKTDIAQGSQTRIHHERASRQAGHHLKNRCVAA